MSRVQHKTMPVLSNQRHEAFAQALAKGSSADAAYEMAGFKPRAFGDQSGYYVYLLISPLDGRVFYVGKGKQRRARCHWADFRNGKVPLGKKRDELLLIHHAGQEPRIDILQAELSESEAYEIEAAMITAIGYERLANVQPGTESPRVKAKRMLDNVKPFCDWVTEKKRSLSDIEMYWFVKDGLTHNAGALA